MKLSLLLILICIFVVQGVSAQDKAGEKWTRLESRNHEVSAAFPPGYFIDTLNDAPGLEAYVFGYKDGVRMEMRIAKNPMAKAHLRMMPAATDGRNETNFSTNKFQGRRIWSGDAAETFHETTYLASDSYLYIFNVKATDVNKPAIERFLHSIQVGAKPLYVRKEKEDYPEEIVSLEKIKSSPEVIEAYRREFKKKEIKAEYQPMSAVKVTESGGGIRPPIVLGRGRLNYKFDYSRGVTSGNGTRTYHAKLRVNFLANGEIGDITAFSDESRGYMEACIESIRKARFIPAWNGVENIDFVSIEDCIVSTTVVDSPGFVR